MKELAQAIERPPYHLKAEAVWQAANDRSGRLRFAAGADAVALAA